MQFVSLDIEVYEFVFGLFSKNMFINGCPEHDILGFVVVVLLTCVRDSSENPTLFQRHWFAMGSL